MGVLLAGCALGFQLSANAPTRARGERSALSSLEGGPFSRQPRVGSAFGLDAERLWLPADDPWGAVLPVRAKVTKRLQAIAALRVGSFAGPAHDFGPGLGIANQVLGGLLGGPVALDAASYQDLFAANVTLADLIATRRGVGTVAEFLDLKLTAHEFLALLGDALAQRRDQATSVVGALSRVASATGAARIGDWLHVAPRSADEALAVVLNVYDLVQASALAAHGANPLVIDALETSGRNAAQVRLRALPLEPPQIGVGPPGKEEGGEWRTEVRSARVRLELTLRSASSLALIGSVPVTLTIYSSNAESKAQLSAIEWGKGSGGGKVGKGKKGGRERDTEDRGARARVTVEAQPGLWRVGIGAFSDMASEDSIAPATLAELKLLGKCVAKVTEAIELTAQSAPETLTFDGPFVPRIPEPMPSNTKTVGVDLESSVASAAGELSNELVVEVAAPCSEPPAPPLPIGLSKGMIQTSTEAIVRPLLTEVPALLAPALRALGVQTGGADVTVLSVHAGSSGSE